MPTNAMRIQRMADSSFDVKVWGPDGVQKNLTAQFQQITGPEAPSTFKQRIFLANASYHTEVEFTSPEFDLRYKLDPEVAKQLVAIAEA